ncbi:hypothetical protein [Paenibacillus agricola]|uniref:Uncharacterized protein n=1 Tax=Paenibacillus agricola TaxID=2716264 RepID=A0ABX0JAN8_9BACL|nr:hypothetical protein [Paenibacillus agricola]NHN33212.1 hypothetical protein [Paenibacillus agricola]
MFNKLRNYLTSKKSLHQYLEDLNKPIYFPAGPTVKAITDQQFAKFKLVIALMKKEELLNPQCISDSRIIDLAIQSNVDASHIRTLFFYFEIEYRMNLPKDPFVQIEFFEKELAKRGLRGLNDLQ